jgi:hypothetical protein
MNFHLSHMCHASRLSSTVFLRQGDRPVFTNTPKRKRCKTVVLSTFMLSFLAGHGKIEDSELNGRIHSPNLIYYFLHYCNFDVFL